MLIYLPHTELSIYTILGMSRRLSPNTKLSREVVLALGLRRQAK
jgi:hypothetical protein